MSPNHTAKTAAASPSMPLRLLPPRPGCTAETATAKPWPRCKQLPSLWSATKAFSAKTHCTSRKKGPLLLPTVYVGRLRFILANKWTVNETGWGWQDIMYLPAPSLNPRMEQQSGSLPSQVVKAGSCLLFLKIAFRRVFLQWSAPSYETEWPLSGCPLPIPGLSGGRTFGCSRAVLPGESLF